MRIHLLIAPPSSGTITLATRLQGELKACGQWAAVVPLPTEASDRHGDGVIWRIMQRVQRLQRELARVDPFFPDPPPRIALVIEGCFYSREQRLSCLRRFDSGWPIEWVGWLLHTPLAIGEITAAAQESKDGLVTASIEEGFSAIVNLNPLVLEDAAGGEVSEVVVDAISEGIDACCAEVLNQRHRLRLHAYSRLIDFDRLMRDLAARLQPQPPDRLDGLRDELGDCSLDRILTHAQDLCWLLGSGLLQPRIPGLSQDTICAPEPSDRTLRHRGGWHRYADAGAFERLMEELRRFVQSDEEHPHQPSQELQELIDRYGLQPFASAVPQQVS